jgi:hypothetical protein
MRFMIPFYESFLRHFLLFLRKIFSKNIFILGTESDPDENTEKFELNVSIDNGLATSTPRTCSNSSKNSPNLKSNILHPHRNFDKTHQQSLVRNTLKESHISNNKSKNMEKNIIKAISYFDNSEKNDFASSNKSIDTKKSNLNKCLIFLYFVLFYFCLIFFPIESGKISQSIIRN